MVAERVDTRALGVEMLSDALRRGEAVEITSFGFSMWPRIQNGSMVHIEPCSGSDATRGDVVLFEGRGRLVLHRVLRERASQVFIKGDACFDADGWVERKLILGRIPPRRGDTTWAKLSPLLSWPLGLGSVFARRISRLSSKF